MKTLKNTIIFLGVMVLGSCCKDKPIPITKEPIKDNCPSEIVNKSVQISTDLYKGEMVSLCPRFPDYITTGNFAYYYVSPNPNNEYEFCFIRKNNSTGLKDLCKFNFCTGIITSMAKNVSYSPNWSKKNWIIYTGINNQLWKIKNNGDSLIQLTNTNSYNNHAKWNLSGTKYVYYDASAFNFKIANEYGNIEKNFKLPMLCWNWYSENEIVYCTNVGASQIQVSKYDINTTTTTVLATVEGGGVEAGNINVHKNEIVFDTKYAVYSITNNDVTLIDKNYQSFYATAFQVLTDNYYINNRGLQDTTGFDSCIVYGNYHINLVNKFTKEERQILLPE